LSFGFLTGAAINPSRMACFRTTTVMMRRDGARVRFFTRNGHDWAETVEDVAQVEEPGERGGAA